MMESKRTWAYTRDSGGDDQSVDDQNRAVDRYCREQGHILERLFCDRARPGSSVAGREQFQAMIHLVRSLPAEQLPAAIVFWSFSRCARDFDDAQYYKADIRRRGVAVESIADDIPDGPHGRLIEAIIDWKNAQFLEDLSRDVQRGLQDLARQGYAPGGFPPRGYLAEKIQIGIKNDGDPHYASLWVPDPDLVPRVKQAWQMRAQGATYSEIHTATRIFGSTNSYACMFRNKTYLGVRKCGDIEVPDAHEPLISREIWDAVQATMQKRPGRGESWDRHPRRVSSPFLLTGLARCAYCGSAMSASATNLKTRPNPWPYYICGKKKRKGYNSCEGRYIQAHNAERVILEAVIDQVLGTEYVDELVEAVNGYLDQDIADVDVQIDRVHAKIRDVDHAIEGLLDLAEKYSAETAGERLLRREAERKALEQELQRLRSLRQQSHIEASPEAIHDVLTTAREDLTGGDVKARRTTLRQFVSKVEMRNEKGRIYCTFPLERILLPTSLYLVPPKGFEPLSRA
jgi:site-specific DNA recombinase